MSTRRESNKISTVDDLMDRGIRMDFSRVQDQVLSFSSATAAFDRNNPLPAITTFIQTLEEAFGENKIKEFQDRFEDLAALILMFLNGDPEFAKNSLFTALIKRLNDSAIISDDISKKIVESLKTEIPRFLSKVEIDGSNERERLAYFLRMLNLRDLKSILSTISEIPRLRKKIAAINGERKGLVAGTYKESSVLDLDGLKVKDIGERQKIIAPLLDQIVADDELRYYLSLAIDEASKERTEDLLADIDKAPEGRYYIPAITIGFGVYGQVINNELMHYAPEAAENSMLTIDANPWIGGQFARGTRPVFRVNNRVRPEKAGVDPIPGTEANIMPLGDHAIVDLPAVSSDTYPAQNLLGAALKTNGFMNSRKSLVNCEITGVRRNNGRGSAKYVVSFFEKSSNRSFEVYTDEVLIADGIGGDNFGFDDKFDVPTRKITAESKQNLAVGKKASYYKASDFLNVASSEASDNWRKDFAGEGIVIGTGDSGIVELAAILGYGPANEGTTQGNFTQKINWLGQPAQDADQWCDNARTRYVDIAREFPRSASVIGSKKLADQEVFSGIKIFSNTLKLFRQIKSQIEALKLLLLNRTVINSSYQPLRALIAQWNSAPNDTQVSLPSITFPDGAPDLGFLARLESYFDSDKIAAFEDAEIRLRENLRDRVRFLESLNQFLRPTLSFFQEFERNMDLAAFEVAFERTRKSLERFRPPFYDNELKQKLLPPNFNGLYTGTSIRQIKNRVEKILEEANQEIAIINDDLSPVAKKNTDPSDGKIQPFYRIKPIGVPGKKGSDGKFTKEPNTLDDGKTKVCRAIRMAKETIDIDGELVEKIRVFYNDAEGKETSVLADWVIDATGQKKRTDSLFDDFGDVKNEIPVNSPSPKDLFSSQRSILEFNPDGNENKNLNGLMIEVVELQKSDDRFAAKIEVLKPGDNNKKKKFIFDVVGKKDSASVTQAEVIPSDPSVDALRIAQALKIWITKPSIGRIKTCKTREPAAAIGKKEVMLNDQKSLIPLALQVVSRDGVEENIYIVGPSTNTPITERERAEVPALVAVDQNLASMFRYVPPVQEFVRRILVPSLKSKQKPYVLDTARYQVIREGITAAVSGVEDVVEAKPNGLIKKESLGKIPKIADPEVVVDYYLRKVFAKFFEFKPEQKVAVSLYREANGDIQWELIASEDETQGRVAGRFAQLLENKTFLGALANLMPRSKANKKEIICRFTKHVADITQEDDPKKRKDIGNKVDSFLRLDFRIV